MMKRQALFITAVVVVVGLFWRVLIPDDEFSDWALVLILGISTFAATVIAGRLFRS